MAHRPNTLALLACTAASLLVSPSSHALGGCATDGAIASRADLNDILGGNLVLEDFETYVVTSGSSEYIGVASIDENTVVNGQGPGLVQPGARYVDPSGTAFQWNADQYYQRTTQTILSYDTTGGAIVIDYTQFVDAMGIDFSAFIGYGYQGLVEVYDTGLNLVGSSNFQLVNGGPERVFFGWYHAAGIGRVIAYNLTNPSVAGSAKIDDHGYGDCSGLGTKYCTANANSTGSAADISASGSSSSSAGDLTLTSAPVPNQPGIFYHGMNQSQTPFGNGFMCTTGNIVRGAVVPGVGNTATYTYDNSDAQHSLAAFIGTTRHFQHWYRDPAGGGAFFNTSNAISIGITP